MVLNAYVVAPSFPNFPLLLFFVPSLELNQNLVTDHGHLIYRMGVTKDTFYVIGDKQLKNFTIQRDPSDCALRFYRKLLWSCNHGKKWLRQEGAAELAHQPVGIMPNSPLKPQCTIGWGALYFIVRISC